MDPKLIAWVKEYLSKGYSKEKIADQLIQKGYTLEQVTMILQEVTGKAPSQVLPRKKPVWLWIGIVVILLLIISLFFLFSYKKFSLHAFTFGKKAAVNMSNVTNMTNATHQKYKGDFITLLRNDIVPAIVQIRCYDGVSKEPFDIGTGFYYTQDGGYYVATNAHVLLADDGLFHGCDIYFPYSNGGFYQAAFYSNYVWPYYNKESVVNGITIRGIDYAVLNVSEAYQNQNGTPYLFPPQVHGFFESINKTCSPKNIQLGDKIYVLGYPGGGEESETITEGIVSGFLGDFGQ